MRGWLIHERLLSVLTAQAREAAIVTITQRQATTAPRNARVTRCLKQNPTRLYKDATSSLKRRTRECFFREKALLACWSTHGRWSSATQTGGSAAWCVQSTRHGKNHHHCSALPPARQSSEDHAQLVEFTRSAEVRSRTMQPLNSEAKSWICAAPAAYLYSQCDQRQLDAIIACQCALARLVYTRSRLVSLSEIPFVSPPTSRVTDWYGTVLVINVKN